MTIAWQPVTGVPHYIVYAFRLFGDASSADLAPVATFDTTTTSVRMPASRFHIGDEYVFDVSAVVDDTTDYQHGQLRGFGFPRNERPATTARLLFAASCGNGVVDAPYEECDASGETTAACNADCTIPRCGDGITNTANGETCDDVEDSLTCDSDCTARVCGDGHRNFAANEECDDGNTRSGDGCSETCTREH